MVSGALQVSLQHAAALDVPLFVSGAEQLDGLFVDQSPEVLEGNALTALNAHLLQNLTQTFFILHGLETGNRKSAQIPADGLQYKALFPIHLQYLGKSRQLIGDHALELGAVHGWSVICSFMELCDQRIDGQLQI